MLAALLTNLSERSPGAGPSASGGGAGGSRRKFRDTPQREQNEEAFDSRRDERAREIRARMEEVHDFLINGPREPTETLQKAAAVETTIAEFFEPATSTFDLDALMASVEALDRLEAALMEFARARQDEGEAITILLLLSV